MSAYEHIQVERVGKVGIIRLNRPERLNPFARQTIQEIDRAIDEIVQDGRVLILTSAGRAFSSGADLTSLDDSDGSGEFDAGGFLETHGNPLMTKLRDLPIPIISAVRGAAAGFGCSLALSADLVIAGESAYFLQAFSKIGLVPDGGSSYLLVRSLGRARATEMILLAERIPAAQALEWGLIARVVPDAGLDDVVLDYANRLASGPTKSYAMIRKLVSSALDSDWESTIRLERELQRDAGRTTDHAEGVAAFLAKRPAIFTGS